MAGKRQPTTARLLYASTEESADMLYLARIRVPDPFPVIIQGKHSTGLLSMLEFNRALRESSLDKVLPLEKVSQAAKSAYKLKTIGIHHIIAYFAQSRRIRSFEVPGDFPSRLTRQLEQLGLSIRVAESAFFPERVKKSAEEAKAIRLGNAASAAGLRAAQRALAEASILPNCKLRYHGKTLTSERLRTLIEIACLENGAIATGTICAGGDQACDPHEAGHGPLRANELIIIDIFPRHRVTGYHGDMTRTYLKGQPSEAQKQLVTTVRQAQKNALAALKAGVTGKTIHKIAAQTFTQAGYETEQKNGIWQGYIHSTGHGLGLEIHEEPRLSRSGHKRLLSGSVVTIEPGLYYPGLGGCRIEDVAQVHPSGHTLLSHSPYRWRFP